MIFFLELIDIIKNIFYPHDGIWGGVECILRIAIVVIFAGFLYLFIPKARRIGRILKEEKNFFEGINPLNLYASFPNIESRFKDNPLMKNLWQEFDSSLVKSGQSVSTTVESDFYFNEYVLVDIPLKLELIRNVPSILTSLGIIGTFVGVLSGLQGYDTQNIDAVRSSVGNLLTGIQGAFYNSFIAIFFAVVCTGVEKYNVSNLYAKVTQLQRAINRLFNRSLSDDYLHKMVNQMEEQTHSMKSFSQDLAETVKRALEELVERQTETINSANGQLAFSLGNKLAEQLSPALAELTALMEEVKREKAESSSEAIQQIVNRFQDTLTNSASSQLKGMMEAIEGTSEIMASLKGELEKYLQELSKQTILQQDNMRKQLDDLSSQASEGQQQVRTELLSFLEEVSTRLGHIQSELGDHSINYMKIVSEELTKLIATTNQKSEENLSMFSNQIVAAHGQMQNQMKELACAMAKVSSENTSTISTTVSAAMQGINEQTGSLIDAAYEMNGQLLKRMGQLADYVENLASRTTDATVDLTEKLNEGSARLTGLFNQVNDLMNTFGGVLGESAKMTEDLVAGAEMLSTASEEVSHVINDYKKEKDAIFRYIGTFSEQIRLADARFNEFRDLYENYRQSAEQIKNTVENNRSVIAALENTIGDGLTKYVGVTRESIGDYLSALDEQLGTAVEALRSTIEELTENLEEFGELVNQILGNTATPIR